MARYRKVDPRIWNDEKFRDLTDDGKLAFLFVLTHPQMTALGAMRATMSGLADEINWEVQRMRDAMSDAIGHGMVVANPKACFLGLPKFLKYNEPEGPNSVTKAWIEALDLIPECPEKRDTIIKCRKYLDGKSDAFKHAIGHAIWDAFDMPCSMPCPIQEQEQEQDLKKEPSLVFHPQSRVEDAGAKAAGGPKRARPGTKAHGTNPRALGTNPRALGTNPRAPRMASLTSWRRVLVLVDHVRENDKLTWQYVRTEMGSDAVINQAIAAVNGGDFDRGCKSIADRDRFTTKKLEERFRTAYEKLIT